MLDHETVKQVIVAILILLLVYVAYLWGFEDGASIERLNALIRKMERDIIPDNF